jgi:hypothetical protein
MEGIRKREGTSTRLSLCAASGTCSSIAPGLAKNFPHLPLINMSLTETADNTMTETVAFSTKAVTAKLPDADLSSERGLQDVGTGGVLPFSIPLAKDTTILGLDMAAATDVVSEEKAVIKLSGSAVTKKAGPCMVAVTMPAS